MYLAGVSRFFSYLNSAAAILGGYRGEEPFASHLKKFFAAQKKYGSRDRKEISHLCYSYFRLGKALPDIPVNERILTGLFLCSGSPNNLLETVRPEWNEKVSLTLADKLVLAGVLVADVFPWATEISEGIDIEQFAASFFTQPSMFLRLRPGREAVVKHQLTQAGINFIAVTDSCLELANATKVDEIIQVNKDAVVQDLSSQRVGELLQLVRQDTSHQMKLNVWDCCAASGGKSILAKDVIGNIELTVSDVRESILQNLRKRFAEAGITGYKSFCADIASPDFRTSGLPSSDFQLIICDVPCTGSGTWGRTPEQLYYFNNKQVDEYAALQKLIVANAITRLQKGGYFLYITCSVFKKENEAMVEYIKENLPAGEEGIKLQLVKMEILKGYDKKADTMFAALLHLPL